MALATKKSYGDYSRLLFLSDARFAKSRRSCPPLSREVPLQSREPALFRPLWFRILSQTVFRYHPQREHKLSPESGFPSPRRVCRQGLCWFPRESAPALSPPPPPHEEADAPASSTPRC